MHRPSGSRPVLTLVSGGDGLGELGGDEDERRVWSFCRVRAGPRKTLLVQQAASEGPQRAVRFFNECFNEC